jgi:hypothetical protein
VAGPLQLELDQRICSLWLEFLLRNLTATNKTLVPLNKKNNKILFYIKKIKNKKIKEWLAIPLEVARPP